MILMNTFTLSNETIFVSEHSFMAIEDFVLHFILIIIFFILRVDFSRLDSLFQNVYFIWNAFVSV